MPKRKWEKMKRIMFEMVVVPLMSFWILIYVRLRWAISETPFSTFFQVSWLYSCCLITFMSNSLKYLWDYTRTNGQYPISQRPKSEFFAEKWQLSANASWPGPSQSWMALFMPWTLQLASWLGGPREWVAGVSINSAFSLECSQKNDGGSHVDNR